MVFGDFSIDLVGGVTDTRFKFVKSLPGSATDRHLKYCSFHVAVLFSKNLMYIIRKSIYETL